MDVPSFLSFRFLMFLKDGIVETNHVLPFVVLEELKSCAPKKKNE